jgi:hypothetical protein
MADRIEIQSHEPAGSRWTAMIEATRAGGCGPPGFVSLMLALCALVTCTELTDQDPARDGLVLVGLGIFLLVMAGNFVWLISHLHRVARSGAHEPLLEGAENPAELYRDDALQPIADRVCPTVEELVGRASTGAGVGSS